MHHRLRRRSPNNKLSTKRHFVDPSRRRICVVGSCAGPVLFEDWDRRYTGGAEVQQVLLARALADRGHDVSFIIQSPDRPPTLTTQGIRVYAYRAPRLAPGVNAFVKCARLWRLLSRIQPEIIYQRMADWTTGVCAAYAQQHGIALFHAVASDRDVHVDEEMDGNWWQSKLYSWGLRRASVVLAQHRGQWESLRSGFGIDAQVFPSVYADAPVEADRERAGVYWVSMIRPNKRPEFLLELARRLPDVPFVLVGGPEGDAESRYYYDRIAACASEIPNVRFTGFLSPTQVDAELSRAALLVSTTQPRREGLPVSFLQAWRQAVPTVGFAAAGLDDALQQTGWSVRNPDELAEVVRSVYADPQRRRARGLQARRYFSEHHAMSVVIPKFEALMGHTLTRLGNGVAQPHSEVGAFA